MEKNESNSIAAKIEGITVEAVAFYDFATVINFTDGTFLDIYIHSSKEKLNISTNTL